MSKSTSAKPNPALAATEKARKAAVAEIDARLAKGQQDHEEPSPKEAAHNAPRSPAKPAAARAKKGKKPAFGERTAKAPDKNAHGPTSAAQAAKAKTPNTKAPRAPRKLSALDAAAQVLASAKAPMRAKELIGTMAASGLWKSPGGKTPEATLSAAMRREIKVKGSAGRFKRDGRGLFAALPAPASRKKAP